MILDKETLRITHVVAGLHPKSGGPSRTIVQLCDALSGLEGIEVTLLSQAKLGEAELRSQSPAVSRPASVSDSALALALGIPFRSTFMAHVGMTRPGIIHNNGLWNSVNHWAAFIAHAANIPLIIQPHGMLAPWALQHKAWKKKLAMVLYQKRDLESAKLFVATSEAEYKNIRAQGFRQPVAIIPNGVVLGDSPDSKPGSETAKNVRVVLFLGRIHPVKGLLNLVSAWAQLLPEGWRLCMAGPDEGGHLAEVKAHAQKLGIIDYVDFPGEVDDSGKAALYNEADLFVLPSFTENFGVVVAEALAHGIPVIATKGAPWAVLEEWKCGWWVDIGAELLAKALKEAIGLSTETRHEMGLRGRRLVEENYSWDKIGKEMLSVYEWVLRGGKPPSCVMLD